MNVRRKLNDIENALNVLRDLQRNTIAARASLMAQVMLWMRFIVPHVKLSGQEMLPNVKRSNRFDVVRVSALPSDTGMMSC